VRTWRRLPRWLRVALITVNVAASLAVLGLWWASIWPNLAAAWIGAAPAGGAATWAAGRFDRAVDRIDSRLEAHSHRHDQHARALADVQRTVADLNARMGPPPPAARHPADPAGG
jgi:hypothetical protein